MSGLRSIKNRDIFDKSKSLLLIPKNEKDLCPLCLFLCVFADNYRGSWMAFKGLSKDFSARPISSKTNKGIFLSAGFLLFFY